MNLKQLQFLFGLKNVAPDSLQWSRLSLFAMVAPRQRVAEVAQAFG